MTYLVFDSGHRGECRSERAEQIDCMSWVAEHYPERFGLCFHPANEVTVDKKKKGWLLHLELRRRQGVKKGVSDIIDLTGTQRWRSGVFELKIADRSEAALEKDQRAFLERAAANGSFAAVCYGFSEFKRAWAEYLKEN